MVVTSTGEETVSSALQTVQDLWDNPAEVADFLNLDNWR